MVGSGTFVKLRKGTRALPELETANMYPCFSEPMPVEVIISVNLNLFDFLPSRQRHFLP